MTGTPAQIAKAALRRLAQAQREPTPDNFRAAWLEEGGDAAAAPLGLPERTQRLLDRLLQRGCDDDALRAELVACLSEARWDDLQRAADRQADAAAAQAQAWAVLLERMARGLERGSRAWTPARRKDSLQRVLDGSRSDAQRLQHRLRQLVTGWEQDVDEAAPDAIDPPDPADGERAAEVSDAHLIDPSSQPIAAALQPAAVTDWLPIAAAWRQAVTDGLAVDEPRAAAMADELAALADRLAGEGVTAALLAALDDACRRAGRLLAHRHHLVEQLSALCRELTGGLVALAEDDSWARGQAQMIDARLEGSLGARSVKAAGELLARTRERQGTLREERDRARDALRALVASLLQQLGELGDETGRLGDRLGGYGDAIAAADSINDLAGLVQRMVADSRAVQHRLQESRDRLLAEHARAGELESRVRGLEAELRRLAEEVSTDALTQVANRRGMQSRFDAERSRIERDGGELAIGLLDIDNFKKLNDSLGHAAGDTALKSLAAHVRDALRPADAIARFGGEEFVVLLPGTGVVEAQHVLTRLQRSLSASLFMHEGREVFVTFSAGVTAWRAGEALDAALERADEALYEAKRTGKNRTCVG